MTLELLALFFSALCGGLIIMIKPNIWIKSLRLLLSFSAGYLLAITFLHLLPDLFASELSPTHTGSYIMIGFFLQRFIESFSAGVEHGHAMTTLNHCCIHNLRYFPFLISITVHALLDGSILTHTHHGHTHEGLLAGMMLHKFLEAFALMSVLRGFTTSIKQHYLYLALFSLTSPVGFGLSKYMNHRFADYNTYSNIMLAIVTGNFLYISATMLFETSPEHKATTMTIWTSLLGAGLASCIQWLS